jgi:glycosyltransferase involved in cell wall biosynthesis
MEKQERIKFSLLLCTLNRKILLKKCVKSLLKQSYKNYEIIIVDQSDERNDDYKGIAQIKYLHISQKGLSNARNYGLQFVEGDYVALIDDDAVYDPKYLEVAAEFINSREENIGIVSGKGIDPDTKETLLKKMESAGTTQISWGLIFDLCMSAMMIIRRNVLNGGFDADFGVGAKYGAGEETDLVIRALENKELVFYVPEMIVYHKSTRSVVDLERAYKYSMGFGALLKKHYVTYNKGLFLILFIKLLCRSIAGCMLFFCGNKKYERSVYTLRGKLYGFRNYENME